MSTLTKFNRYSGLLGASLVLSACGGGGGGDVAPIGGPAAPAPTETYLFFQGSLAAVDPAAPTTPIFIEPAGTAISGLAAIEAGQYNAGTRRVSDVHFRTLVYGRGANLWKVNAVKGGAAPTAVRVSSEASIGTDGICESFYASDFADHNNSRYAYEIPGADNDCSTGGDNLWRLVRVGMNDTTLPITSANIDEPLTVIRDVTSGAITGWLRLAGTNLVRYDADFGNPITVANLVGSVQVVAMAPNGRVFLKIDSELKIYDPASYPTPGAGLSLALHTFTGALGSVAFDDTYAFFLDGGYTLYRVPLDGSATAGGPFLTEAATSSVGQLTLTGSRLVYAATDGGIVTVKSVLKSGGAAVPIKTAAALQSVSLVAAADNRIYYNVTTGFAFPNIAGTVLDNGDNLFEHLSSFWSGRIRANEKSLMRDAAISHIGLFDAASSLSIYRTGDHVVTATVGSAPADINSLFAGAYNNLGHGLAFGTSGAASDIFYFNLNSAGSLQRVTTTADNEVVVGGCTLARNTGFDPVLGLLFLAGLLSFRKRRG